MRGTCRFWLGIGILIVLSGCQRALNDQRKVDVKSAEVKSVLYDVQERAKTVKIVIRSEGEPVDAYLVLEKDRVQLVEQLTNQNKPTGALASALRMKETWLAGSIPARSAFAVVLVSPKDTSVTIQATEGP